MCLLMKSSCNAEGDKNCLSRALSKLILYFIRCSYITAETAASLVVTREELDSVIRVPFVWHRLTLIPARIIKHMPNKVWADITYPFPNGCSVWRVDGLFCNDHNSFWSNVVCHEDGITWKRFPHYWPLLGAIHQLSVDSLTKGQ